MTGALEFDGIVLNRGSKPHIALTVSDALDADSIPLRIGSILERTSGLSSFDCVRVKDDIRSPEAFAETVSIIGSVFDRGLVLESSEPGSILSALSVVGDRRPLVCSTSTEGFDGIMMAASVFDCPIVACGRDLEALLDIPSGCSAGVALDPMAVNMKSCLESNTDLHRLASRIPEADHPIVTRAWSGEYALSMASISVMRYGDLILIDDLGRDACEVLDRLCDELR